MFSWQKRLQTVHDQKRIIAGIIETRKTVETRNKRGMEIEDS